jgi:hypothetical protein
MIPKFSLLMKKGRAGNPSSFFIYKISPCERIGVRRNVSKPGNNVTAKKSSAWKRCRG